jgi:hypothetical protein
MYFFPSSKLFFACDVIIFPYLFVPISGVLFDALAHGLPFVASDFFMKFARMDRGITCSRNIESFSEATDLNQTMKISKNDLIQHVVNSRYVYKLSFNIIELNSSS